MEIKSISEIGGVSAEALAAEYLHVAHPPASQVALASAKAEELETLEQRAAGGDQVAAIELDHEHQRQTPVESQHVLPLPAQHPPGAHEQGKGDLIDVYD